MLRTRRLVAWLCLAALLCAVLAPAAPGHFAAVLTTLWLFAPPILAVLIPRQLSRPSAHPSSLLSLDASRAPPVRG